MDRESFFARKKQTTTVTLADGSTVTARKLSQHEVETITKSYSSDAKAVEGLRYVVCRTVVGDDGQRVFKDDDMAKLASDVDFDDVKKIAEQVMRFSGLKVPDDAAEGEDGKKDLAPAAV